MADSIEVKVGDWINIVGQGILFEVTYLYKYENSSLWLNTLWTSIFFKYWGVTCRPPVDTKTSWTCMRTSLIFLKVINVSIYCKNMTSFVNYLMLFHDRWILPRMDNEMGRFIPKDNPWPHDHICEKNTTPWGNPRAIRKACIGPQRTLGNP